MPIPNNTEFEGRPTLPSIHTLNLPSLSRPKHRNVKYDTYDNLRQNPSDFVSCERQVSPSSSHTTAPCSASPSPSSVTDADSDGEIIPMNAPKKFRLIPCPLGAADAIILVTDKPIGTQPFNYTPRQGKAHGVLILALVAALPQSGAHSSQRRQNPSVSHCTRLQDVQDSLMTPLGCFENSFFRTYNELYDQSNTPNCSTPPTSSN